MRSLALNGTAVDRNTLPLPFGGGNPTVILCNGTAGDLTVQESDTVGGSYSTVAVVPDTGSIEAQFTKQWVKVSTAAEVWALSN
jgi:hypothetical protein